MIKIKSVSSKADWNQFIEFPWLIYRGDPNWVPPLRMAVRDMLDVNKNPFFKHALMHPVLALKDNRMVGRIVGVIDEHHNKFHKEKTAFFGFFEAINDQEVANALLDEVLKWGKAQGMSILRGPVNLSTNYECGLLVEGFNDPPQVQMTYNPTYYQALLEKWGLAKVKDLFAYNIHAGSKFSERVLAQAERLRANSSVSFRTINMRKFDEEVERILDIYNDAWEQNWGFVPVEPEEFRHIAKDMKLILDPRLVLVAEVRGEPAAFSLALPDINRVLRKIPDGKLLPTGIFKLLWNFKGPGRKKTVDRCRVITLGIKKAYREFGLGPLLYTEYLKSGPSYGYYTGEASWILEDNRPMNRALEMMCGQRSKVYRLYDRAIG